MAFWREHMPAGMFLRSGPDWHLDPAGELTFARYLDERQISEDPIPLAVFLAYTEWFTAQAGLDVEDERVTALRRDGHFVAETANGPIEARQVVAAPGIAHFTNVPEWATDGEHTCDLVDFGGFEGARVLIVGGRQSAYEWAALLSEHGAEHIDVVHRHATPRFAQVSWAFVDPLIEQTLARPGWFRNLPRGEQDAIGRQFWEVGRLTLEPGCSRDCGGSRSTRIRRTSTRGPTTPTGSSSPRATRPTWPACRTWTGWISPPATVSPSSTRRCRAPSRVSICRDSRLRRTSGRSSASSKAPRRQPS
jgi:hypothetical protein